MAHTISTIQGASIRPIFILATLIAMGAFIFACSAADNTNRDNGATADLAAAAQGSMAEADPGRLAAGLAPVRTSRNSVDGW